MNTHRITYCLSAMLALSLLPACSRMEKAPEAGTETAIRFSDPVQTRATDAVGQSDVFQVRDWHNDNRYYIENTLKWSANDSRWDYGTSQTYEWAYGTHLFFSWLQSDESYSTTAFFGPNLRASGNTLTLPATTLSTSSHQYDFLYSNPVCRATADNDYSDVPLLFNHLFAMVAISFQISDDAPAEDSPIHLYSVSLNENFKNRKGANIVFGTDGNAQVEFTDVAHDGDFATLHDFGGMSFGKGATPIDVLSQSQDGGKDFYYVWPATTAELVDQKVIDVVYQIDGEAESRTSHLAFPKGTSWQGGHKYSYTITYTGGVFKVVESVLDWDYTSLATTVEEQSVMASWVGWEASTCTIDGLNVTFKTDAQGRLMPIHGMFKIFSPTQCTYHINLSSDAEKFTITPNDGTNTHVGYGSIGTAEGDINPGVTIDFWITASDEVRPAAGQDPISANLAFSVQASASTDREYSLDSEIQHDGAFTIIIPSM